MAMVWNWDEDGSHWIESGGGPLLFLDRRWLGDWRGHPEWASDPAGDYGRACAIGDTAGLLSVGYGIGLVLGDEPLLTGWHPLPDRRGGLIVRWRFAPNRATILAALADLAAVTWEDSRLMVPVPTGQAVIFDAADSGEEVEECLSLPLIPGTYRVETAEYAPDARTALLLHRLLPVAA